MAELCLEGKTMKNWVILFARTGSEEKLMDILKEKLNADQYLPFVPTKETPYRNKGVVHKLRKPLFPGYVFVQTEMEPSLIADELTVTLKSVKEVYSILHYGDNKKDVAVREEERSHWERLFNTDFCIVGSVGFIEGDTVRIISGALIGLEGQIKKINRHSRQAVVEMVMVGAVREVTLMLEIVEKM
jgi:transcriptional antiterminator NusG